MQNRILIVEDDKVIAELEKEYLTANGYGVDICYNAESGLTAARERDYDLILLDVMMPEKSGFEMCRDLRKEKDTPVLFVTARQDETDILAGFDMGGDDYIAKPFNFKELLARVNVHVNRYKQLARVEINDELEIDSIKLSNSSRRIWLDGKEIQMTNKEFDLLWFLATHPNKVFTKEELLKKIWGYSSVGDTSTVTVHINRIREKTDNNASGKHFIETIWGVGYRFKE